MSSDPDDTASGATASAHGRSLRDELSALHMPRGEAPAFDPEHAPDSPFTLYAEWLRAAVEAEVPAPHAVVLATADASGRPAARTLLITDVVLDTPGDPGAGHVAFASLADSPKGAELTANPRAAIVAHYREQHRQIRISGRVVVAPREESEQDFSRRPTGFKTDTIAERQSAPLPEDPDRRRAGARELLAGDPNFVPPAWTVWHLLPEQVEFWQGPPGKPQQRLRYRLADRGWATEQLWP